MKKNSILSKVLFLSVLATLIGNTHSSEAAQHKTVGIGVILGEPSGLTGKVWIDTNHAIDIATAFSTDNYFLIYSDYLFHFPKAFGSSSPFLPYAGIGGVAIFSGNSTRTAGRYFSQNTSVGIGVRIPLGIEWLIPDSPIGVFAELVPGVGIIPGTYGFFQGGIGGRFYFY